MTKAECCPKVKIERKKVKSDHKPKSKNSRRFKDKSAKIRMIFIEERLCDAVLIDQNDPSKAAIRENRLMSKMNNYTDHDLSTDTENR
jgi:hypothetical protein